jgi:mono/diheme cytochrome c family protein
VTKLTVKGVLPALAVGGLLAGAVVPRTHGQTNPTSPEADGIYSEAQAIRGQSLYNEVCGMCHGEALAGLDQAPPLAGPQFASVWQGEPLAALVERIGTMPPDKPGSLTRAESVDVLSYILWYNGLPIGDRELGAEQRVLASLRFESPLLTGQ